MEFSESESVKNALFDELELLYLMGGNRDDVDALLEASFAEAQEKMATICSGIEKDDFESIQQAAMSLQGDAATIKSAMLRIIAARTAKIAKKKDIDEVICSVQELDSALKSLKSHLKSNGWLQKPN